MRLLEVLAGHAAVAVENAQPLRVGAARGRERDLAARVRPRARDARRASTTSSSASSSCPPSSSVSRARPSGSRRGRLSCARTASTATRAERSPSCSRSAVPARGDPTSTRDPLHLRAERLRAGDRSDEAPAPGGRYAIAPFVVDGRARHHRRARRAGGLRRARAARCSAASRTRRSSRSRTLELRGARADVRLHRRGARERARGERRVHVDACALDHRPLAARRPRARPRRARAEAPRARRAAARHRQDRHPERRSSRSPAG